MKILNTSPSLLSQQQYFLNIIKNITQDSVSIDHIYPMDMKLISATVWMLVSPPYIIFVDYLLQIYSFKTSYALYSSCIKATSTGLEIYGSNARKLIHFTSSPLYIYSDIL